MMKSLFLFVVAVTVISADDRCGKGGQYSDRADLSCANTCQHPDRQLTDDDCSLDSDKWRVEGCVCKEGYVLRNKDAHEECIDLDDCPETIKLTHNHPQFYNQPQHTFAGYYGGPQWYQPQQSFAPNYQNQFYQHQHNYNQNYNNQ